MALSRYLPDIMENAITHVQTPMNFPTGTFINLFKPHQSLIKFLNTLKIATESSLFLTNSKTLSVNSSERLKSWQKKISWDHSSMLLSTMLKNQISVTLHTSFTNFMSTLCSTTPFLTTPLHNKVPEWTLWRTLQRTQEKF